MHVLYPDFIGREFFPRPSLAKFTVKKIIKVCSVLPAKSKPVLHSLKYCKRR